MKTINSVTAENEMDDSIDLMKRKIYQTEFPIILFIISL